MGSTTAVESNLDRIEEFFQSSSYQHCLELSTTFNSRLARERKLRLPFLDLQTGIAQRHCAQVKAKQRMPGLRAGQLYTFPAQRWRKNKRLCLAPTAPSERVVQAATLGATSGGFLNAPPSLDDNSNSNASFLLDKFPAAAQEALDDTNSRDTNNNNNARDEEMIKYWFSDDLDNDFDDTYSEPKSPPDEEYDPRYGTKKRTKKASKKEAKAKKGSAAVTFTNFDFGGSTKGSGGRGGRKDSSSGTPRKTPGRKAASGKNKKSFVVDPPSFESAAASMDSGGAAYATSDW